MSFSDRVVGFTLDTRWSGLPSEVQHQAKRCLLDALGALLAGTRTPVASLMADFARSQFSGDQAAILGASARASLVGAALANGFAGNALDIDDGYRRIKGHPGACVLPAVLAAGEVTDCVGDEFLTALVIGYEVGIRAGLIRHATYTTYHSSGSWGAIAGAAAAGRLLGLDEAQLWHAMGTAEYHAPIAPMMKGIEAPSMGKDSIGWGCLVALSSVLMADRGFTGIRPLFDDTPDTAWISGLGETYEIMNLYFKPYCACRWAQPAVDGALKICREAGLATGDIRSIKVHTFAEAAALSRSYPADTEEAQYNLAFPIAAALVDGEVGPRQVLPPRLFGQDFHTMMDRITVAAEERFQREFPDKALAEVSIETHDGRILTSGVMPARWDTGSTLPTDDELSAKFHWLVAPIMGAGHARLIESLVWRLEAHRLSELIGLCAWPLEHGAAGHLQEQHMDTQQIIDLNHEFTFFTWSVQSQVQPLTAVRGEGVYFWDADGARYLDFSSQLMNVNAGHGNRRIIEAVQAQVASMAYAYPGIATEVRGRLGQLLAEITPGDLCKTLFTTGGGEANENAIKFARLYTGRHKLLARYRSFHGATAGALTLTGDPYRLPVEPLISGVVHFMDPYCYRCPFGWTRETCHRECISHVEQVVEFEGPEDIAAIVLEGVTGSNGLIIPPDDYWPRIRALCDKYGILLVSDEVMSGFGRTGKWFGVDHWGVVPDIMTMGKGITSGYVPLGAVIVSRAIADYFENRRLPMGLTYSGHPVGVAAGVAAVEAYREEGMIENAQRLGVILKEGLEELMAKHPSVGDVRSIGLFSTLELVKDRETKAPLAPLPGMPSAPGDANVAPRLAKAIRERGMHCFVKWNHLFPIPPLCISESELADGLRILDEALVVADEMVE